MYIAGSVKTWVCMYSID